MNTILSRRTFVAATASATLLAFVGKASAQAMKVAIVMPGISTDKSFNQGGYEGAKNAAEKLGLEFAYSEKVAQPDQAEALSDYARRGFNFVIGHGGEFQDAVDRVARRFPDTRFIIVNGTEAGDNVTTMTFDFPALGYVLGYLAGKTSATGKGAYIGAQQIKAYTDLGTAFANGFKAARPDGEVLAAWTNDWDDVAKGKEAALSVIGQGADIVFPSMDNAVAGSLQAAKEQGKMAIGIYYDAIVDWPETVIQSAVFDMRGALDVTLAHAAAGTLEGKSYIYGFETPEAARLGTYGAQVTAEVQADVASLIADIQAGKVTLI